MTHRQTKKLGEVLIFEQPTRYIVKSTKYKDNYETPVLTAGKSFILGKTKEKVGIFPIKDLPVIIFDDFTTATKFVDFPFKVKSSAMKILHPVKNISDARFLFYLIQNISFDHTGIHKRYWISEYSKIEILLPLLPEQHRIVKILDDIFEKTAKAKANAEKNLQNAKDLFESYLQSVFANPGKDWEENYLLDVCEIKSKLVDPRKPEFLDRIHVGAGNMETKSEKLINLRTSKEEKLISGKYLFDNSVVLYSKIRPYLMKVVRPEFDGLCSADIYPLTPIQNKINRDYLFHLLLTQDFTQYAIKGSGRAGMPKVNREHLFAYKFCLPSIKEQESIVAKLDALSDETKKLVAIYKLKLADLEELKKSVLKMAFAGELVEEKNMVPAVQAIVPSPFIRNQVHAAIIDRVASDGGSTSEVAVAKYDHLLQEIFGLSLGYQFQTQNFGPFDAQIKRLVYSGLGRNKWFTKRSGMIVFGNNVNTLLLRQSNLYRAAQSAMKELAKLGITKLDADKVELLSTICHSIKETKSILLDKVRSFMSKWPTYKERTKADKFSSEETKKCLDFIIKNNWHLNLL